MLPGTYSLKAEAPGFKTYLSNGIEIHVQRVVAVDVLLALGGASQTITVTAETAMLQAEDASMGHTVSGESMITG